MWEENFGTQAGIHLIEGVCLIWGPLNTGFTVLLVLAVTKFARYFPEEISLVYFSINSSSLAE